jgi:Bacterial protein of unknown function (Gcw_chp)
MRWSELGGGRDDRHTISIVLQIDDYARPEIKRAWRFFGDRYHVSVVALTAIAGLWVMATGSSAHAESPDNDAAGSIVLGSRAGLAPGAPVVRPQDRAGDSIEFNARAGFATDYIYRGVTLSDRKPALGAGLEATIGSFYAGTTVTSVKLPSQPAAEVTVSSGLRPKLGNIDSRASITGNSARAPIPS